MQFISQEKITGLSAVKTLTVPAGTNVIQVQATTQNVRFTRDGTTTPTATVGQVLNSGDPPLEFSQADGQFGNYQFIEEAASATLEVAYIGKP